MIPPVHSVSWNLTRRCNLRCAHCYLSARPGADVSGDLSTEECRRIIDEIAEVNPRVFLILTGGEPLLRRDLLDVAAAASERGFTVVVGTNGTLLDGRQARLLRQHGVQGVGLSLDSTAPARHDAFRRLPGAWASTVRAARALREEGMAFAVHMSVAAWNLAEIPVMVDLAARLGARVLNLFFLVRTGCGETLTDITREQYEQTLAELARAQGAGRVGRPATVPDFLVRPKCAPHYRRIVWQMDPSSPLLQNYAEGSCPAGRHYCRITPEGALTPCPYMPVSAGSLRDRSFAELWRTSSVFAELREGRLRGRCGACEFARICGGCRCRAYATYGDYLAEDPACTYQPGQYGAEPIEVPASLTFGLDAACALEWDAVARARLERVPSFARGMVVRAVEAYARSSGRSVVTPELMAEVQETWGARFRPSR